VGLFHLFLRIVRGDFGFVLLKVFRRGKFLVGGMRFVEIIHVRIVERGLLSSIHSWDLDVTDDATFAVGKYMVLGLSFSEGLHARNNRIWHG